MCSCDDTVYPVLANAGRRMELASMRLVGARMAPVMRRGERVPLLHPTTNGGVIARPGHEAVLTHAMRSVTSPLPLRPHARRQRRRHQIPCSRPLKERSLWNFR